MKPRTVLVLFLLVAGLGALLWFGERDLPSSDERAERSRRVLVFEPGEVERVTLRGPALQGTGGETVLERRAAEGDEAAEGEEAGEGEWWIARPFEGPADAAAVEGLLERLAGLEKQRTVEGVERSAVGLDEPRGTVTLELEEGGDGETLALEIGAAVPGSSSVLVARPGEAAAHAVAGDFLDDVFRAPDAWRAAPAPAAAEPVSDESAAEVPEGPIAAEAPGEAGPPPPDDPPGAA